MTVYVDPLANWGWRLRGRTVPSCHLFTDTLELDALHAVAEAIGMKRSWFQDKVTAPHYDLTPSRRLAAIQAGAVEIDRRGAAEIWRMRREFVEAFEQEQRWARMLEGLA